MGSGTYHCADARLGCQIRIVRTSNLASACHCFQLVPTPRPVSGVVMWNETNHDVGMGSTGFLPCVQINFLCFLTSCYSRNLEILGFQGFEVRLVWNLKTESESEGHCPVAFACSRSQQDHQTIDESPAWRAGIVNICLMANGVYYIAILHNKDPRRICARLLFFLSN